MNRGSFIKTSALSLAGISSISSLLKEEKINREPIYTDLDADRLDWFKEAKFGLFIHWGLYSVPAGEWNGKETKYAEWIMLKADIPVKRYEQLAKKFNPVDFDAQRWVAYAKAAGMKYIVITAKHHDGFCMFDSKLTDYTITKATPFKRDPIKELAEACKNTGIKLCIYYSVVDWHYPDFPAQYSQIRKEFPKGYPGNGKPDAAINKYAKYMQGQIRELLINYGPIGILWFDGGGSFCNYDRKKLLHGKELVQMIHTLQPACLINNRLGFGADYGTPEQKIPKNKLGTAFEVCMTLNHNWGYSKYDHDWKSSKEVVQNLADIVSKGGNYLLNVGPTTKGVFPSPSGDILKKAGNWLDVFGESIYDCKAGPDDSLIDLKGGVITQKPGKLYLHVFHWPSDGRIFVEGMKGSIVKKVYLLNDRNKKSLPFDAYDRSLMVHVPENPPDSFNSVLVVLYDKKSSLYSV